MCLSGMCQSGEESVGDVSVGGRVLSFSYKSRMEVNSRPVIIAVFGSDTEKKGFKQGSQIEKNSRSFFMSKSVIGKIRSF